jgi:hypothetical protein
MADRRNYSVALDVMYSKRKVVSVYVVEVYRGSAGIAVTSALDSNEWST